MGDKMLDRYASESSYQAEQSMGVHCYCVHPRTDTILLSCRNILPMTQDHAININSRDPEPSRTHPHIYPLGCEVQANGRR